ncbi:MAG: hypothetical protein MJE77_27755 [Proteobacteria bacterium]|nr:hypothetical protein [Pseudomonadota bacterium]
MSRKFQTRESTQVSGLHRVYHRGPRLLDDRRDTELEHYDDEELLALLIDTEPMTDRVKAAVDRFAARAKSPNPGARPAPAQAAQKRLGLTILLVAGVREDAEVERYTFDAGLDALPTSAANSHCLVVHVADHENFTDKLLRYSPDIVHFCKVREPKVFLASARNLLARTIGTLLAVLASDTVSIPMVTYHGKAAERLWEWFGDELRSVGCFMGIDDCIAPDVAAMFAGYIYQELSLGSTFARAFTRARDAAPFSAAWPDYNTVCLRGSKDRLDNQLVCLRHERRGRGD